MKHDTHAKKTSEVNLGFQIAPMIDVVFVIMLFFMVMAGSIKVEKNHNIGLPSPTNPPGEKLVLPGEVIIRVEDDGQVYLNEDPVDSPEVRNLPELANNLNNLRESSTASKSDVFVTIDANEHANYQRIMDVFDALSLAQIAKVTFTASAPE
jgi:biopolymer transport protein ExbD